jgi:hypothetical protein
VFTRLREAGKLPVLRETLIYIKSFNKGEIYVNSTRLINTDATDIYDLTKAELDGQLQCEELTEALRESVPGFENCFISRIAPFLGVRETRRFKGISRLNVNDVLSARIDENTIALAGYKIDVHSGTDSTTLFRNVEKPFGIPYGSLVSAEYKNLMFSGRCASFDAQALASVRVMPYCMAMGEAAGVASALAVSGNISPEEINVSQLRAILRSRGAILDEADVAEFNATK